MRRFAILVVFVVATSLIAQPICNTPPLPVPKIEFLGKNLDNGFMRYWFKVSNRDLYSDALFVSSPQLPPCGANLAASRTWVLIYKDNAIPVYGYCALTSHTQLARLSFAVKASDPQPHSFFIRMNDRKCHRVVQSNMAGIP